MKKTLFLCLLAGTLAGGTAMLPAAPAKKATAARDWSKTVTVTPDGGYRMGNPAAPVKLVEYGSLTCGACGRFAQEGVPQLVSKYVRSGRVSFEFRNYVRDPADMAGALLSRCAPTSNYFALTDRYFTTQQQWVGRLQGVTEAQKAELEKLAPQDRIARFGTLAGLDTMAAQNGVPAARAKACLSDRNGMTQLAKIRQVATDQHKLDGTPMFLLNGKKLDGVHNWSALEPLLKPPGG